MLITDVYQSVRTTVVIKHLVKETSSVPAIILFIQMVIRPLIIRLIRKIGAEDGQITIKNKAQKQYELPETGGSGVKMHYVIGASLALLSLGLITLKIYRDYQKEVTPDDRVPGKGGDV